MVDWKTGDGVSGIDDPAEVDAAFERGERPLGTAVIALAFNCSLEEASPRIVRATRLPDRDQRWFAFTAVAVAARLNGALTPELYAVLRAAGLHGTAEDAIRDTLTFVPYRDLPPWLKRMRLRLAVVDKLDYWKLLATYAAEDVRKALRGRRRS
ncbi:hypothetical protein HLK59_48240 [Streptomyces sp. S3(2020)]|uniref:hypothetical protein n=1 Tax=Streptomyces sp. S3(2020) TaxID=2732044 RepID=UPI0014891625|nr:hypothetical protein [Streptomyces sp. S3(2020)]NNN37971.1 hypothetical protein [Streptomyces sp. S3(2020)]